MISISGNNLVVKTPYDAGFVAELKTRVPATDRKFDGGRKAWLVTPAHGKTVQNLIQQYFGQLVLLPQATSQAVTETRVLEVRYIGSVKERPGGDPSAFAWVNGQWAAIFTEAVLRAWFEGVTLGGPAPADQTLYGVLGIKRGATADDVKRQFRRLAIQWHPDHCKEPNAAERFIEIKGAYDVLNDPNKRARYDAGLALEATLTQQQPKQYTPGVYQPALRCGYVLAEGSETLGRFVVSKILAWEDITNNRGQTLVSSWPMGAQSPVEVWA